LISVFEDSNSALVFIIKSYIEIFHKQTTSSVQKKMAGAYSAKGGFLDNKSRISIPE
jgi:hypothetical protein